MSLPSKVKFYKDGKEIAELFTNCGWFDSEEAIIRGIRETIVNENFNEDWDTAYAYYREFDRESIIHPKPKPKHNQKINIQYPTQITIPITRNKFPQLLADDIVSVQPMKEDTGQIFKSVKSTDNLRMYLLIKEDIDIGHALNSMAHAGCMIPENWGKDDIIMQEWYANSFRKVTCKVNEKQFEKAKEYNDWFVVTEKQFDDKEVILVFKPRKKWEKFFKFLPLYK